MIVTYNYDNKLDTHAAGASLYHLEISKLLKSTKIEDIKFIPHSFKDVLLGKAKLPRLGDEDIVLNNIGPYAWFYHYIREKIN